MKARENPFRVERLEGLAFEMPQAWSPEMPPEMQAAGMEGVQGVVDRLEGLGMRGAIVGPHGSGKTTLLCELAGCLTRRGYGVRRRFLNEDSRLPSWRELRRWGREVAVGEVLLLDGGCHLSAISWRCLVGAMDEGAGLVITAHEAGRLPVLVETQTSVALLERLIARLHPTELPVEIANVEALYQRHGGNLRNALRELYDVYMDEVVGAEVV